MMTIASTFSLGLYEFQGSMAPTGLTLSRSFQCGLYLPVRYPSVSDRVVAHSFALKPAAEEEMTDLATTVTRTHRLG